MGERPELVSAADQGYLLDNRQAGAGARLRVLSAIFDPATFRRVDALGISPGWRCWEVGAGGASVPRWLGERVGPGGRVLATDIDVSWTDVAGAGNVEVRRHDVALDPPPAEAFDLVHARLVLVHVVDRAKALKAMVGALRPGGALLLEDADPALQPLACPDERGADEHLANRIRHDFRALLAERGVDLAYGRKLPRLLRDAGLVDVRAEASFPVSGAECNLLEAATVQQLGPTLVSRGLVSEPDLERHLANVAAGRLDLTTAPMVAAWGFRPQ
jgi:SAM-dependent methyltransferase